MISFLITTTKGSTPSYPSCQGYLDTNKQIEQWYLSNSGYTIDDSMQLKPVLKRSNVIDKTQNSMAKITHFKIVLSQK